MACRTTAVHLTVNEQVAGSNPATPVILQSVEDSPSDQLGPH